MHNNCLFLLRNVKDEIQQAKKFVGILHKKPLNANIIRKRLARAKLSTRLLHSKRYLIVLNGVLPASEEPSVLSLNESTYKKRRPLRSSFFIWYPQANSNRCLHRERVLS